MARQSRTAGLAGLRVHGQRLGREAHGPHDRHQPDLRQTSAATPEQLAARSGQPPVGPAKPFPAGRRAGARQRPVDCRTAVAEDRRPERQAVSARRLLGEPELPDARVRCGHAARASIAAACTPGGSGPSCTRACWPSTLPAARSARRSGRGSNIPQQALVLLNDPTYVEAARVAGRADSQGRRRGRADRGWTGPGGRPCTQACARTRRRRPARSAGEAPGAISRQTRLRPRPCCKSASPRRPGRSTRGACGLDQRGPSAFEPARNRSLGADAMNGRDQLSLPARPTRRAFLEPAPRPAWAPWHWRTPARSPAGARPSRPAAMAGESSTRCRSSGQGETRHLADDGRRALAPGNVRLETQAGRDARQADAGKLDQGPAARAAPGPEAGLLRAADEVRRNWVRAGRRDLRAVSADRLGSPTRSASSAR